MKQHLLEYVKDACQKQFGDELLDVKVSFSVPQQPFVQIVVKTVLPEMTPFAKNLEQEFAELDRHVDVQVLAG